jgi:hypothetical protein
MFHGWVMKGKMKLREFKVGRDHEGYKCIMVFVLKQLNICSAILKNVQPGNK